MFAASADSSIYHLMETTSRTTVCGLSVSRIVRAKRFGSRLHLVLTKPADCRPCKNCLRISQANEMNFDLRSSNHPVIEHDC
jgi:hypothetical protein